MTGGLTANTSAVAGCILFRGLTKKQREFLFERADVKKVPAGTIVYHAGALPTSVIVVASGSLERINLRHEGIVVSVLTKGSAAGYVNLGDPQSRSSFSLCATETTELWSWNLYDLQKTLAKDTELRSTLLAACIKMQSDETELIAASLLLAERIPHIIEGPESVLIKEHSILELLAKSAGADYALVARFDPALQRITIETSLNLPRFPSGTHISLNADTVLSLAYKRTSPILITPASYERKYDSAEYGSPNMALMPLTATPGASGAILLGNRGKQPAFNKATLSRMRLASCGLYLLLNNSQRVSALKELEYLKRSYIGSAHELRSGA